MKQLALLVLASFLAPGLKSPAAQAESLLANGGFEQGLAEWHDLWTRDANCISATLDSREWHGGSKSLRLEHRGDKDWSLAHTLRVKVLPGDIFEYAAWVRVEGRGMAILSVVTQDAKGNTLDWAHGKRVVHERGAWHLLKSRFVVPSGTATIWPRLIGDGPATIWCDDFTLTRQGSLGEMRKAGLPAHTTFSNNVVSVALRTADATFTVTDHRTGRVWVQQADTAPLLVTSAKARPSSLVIKLLDASTLQELNVTAELKPHRAELILSIHGEGPLEEALAWPAPFAPSKGEHLILPVNEGISYPVDDTTLPNTAYHLYGGHGLCMPWYGATDGQSGWMALVETPDDAQVGIDRRYGLLGLSPAWEPQKGAFGATRRLRYVFFDQGGYVAMTSRYREAAEESGLVTTLTEKRRHNPAVDLLVGAVNIWCWEDDATQWCQELHTAGIRRILWSNGLPPAQLDALNRMGVLTSRYDIYQDAMNPTNFPLLRWLHSDWTSEAWAKDDLMTDEDGRWVRGWDVETKKGPMVPCGVLCDRQALPYAQRRIPADMATHPYRCRFIDTTTASPWRECYHPKHPMTRSESKQFKMELLRYVSEGCGLVCGSETGHDAAVPYVHYFEGMMSLGPYRVPEAGRDMLRVWNKVPKAVATFQTGYAYRLPLWELVYHDCVVSHWYWGDYNNKLPALWDRRDLWNALYGTPPMFMFDRKIWTANKARFVKSYETATPVARATGYSRMLSHAWLSPDHAVQQTRFANGIVVTVNFGTTPYTLPNGELLSAGGLRTEGMGSQDQAPTGLQRGVASPAEQPPSR